MSYLHVKSQENNKLLSQQFESLDDFVMEHTDMECYAELEQAVEGGEADEEHIDLYNLINTGYLQGEWVDEMFFESKGSLTKGISYV